jgi:hypothetical protein
VSTHLLDEEQYIEDGYIDASYFGGLLDGEVILTGYLEDDYLDPAYFTYKGMGVTLTATLTQSIQELAADLTSTASISIDGTRVRTPGIINIEEYWMIQTITMERIRGFDSDFAVASTVGSVCNITASGSSDADVDCAITVDIGRIRTDSASFSSAITGVITGTRIRFGNGDFGTVASISISADNIVLVDADLSSAFGQTTDIDRIRSADADISSVSTISIAVIKFRGFGADLDSTFTKSTTANITVDAECSITGAFTPTLVATFLRLGDINMISSMTIAANATRFRDPTATTLENIANLNAQAAIQVGAVAFVADNFALSVEEVYLRTAEADVSAIFAATITANQTAGHSADLSASFNQGVDLGNDLGFGTNVNAVLDDSADLTAASVTTINATRVRTVEVDVTGFASFLSAAGFLLSDIANLSVVSSMTVDCGVTSPTGADLSVTSSISAPPSVLREPTIYNQYIIASLTAEARELTEFSANLSSAFTLGEAPNLELNTDGGVLVAVVADADASLVSAFTTTISAGEIEPGASLAAGVSNLTADVNVIRGAEAAFGGTGGFTTTAELTRTGDAVLHSEFTTSIAGGKLTGVIWTQGVVAGCVTDPSFLIDASSNVTSRSTFTATIGTVAFSTDRTYIVPAETRVYSIPVETRSHTITRENREYSIKGAA